MTLDIEPRAEAQATQEPSDDIRPMLLELKRAIVRAQHELVRTKAVSQSRSHGRGLAASTDGEPRIYALCQARDTLIRLIEAELAKVSDSADAGHDEMLSTQRPDEPALENKLKAVEVAYDHYIEARQILVTVLSEGSSGSRSLAASTTPNISDARTVPRIHEAMASHTHLLPLVSRLSKAAEEQQAHQQQSSYLKRQLAAASAEDRRLISRLADECLMVEPGARDTKAWADAAREARVRDSWFVRARLDEGTSHLSTAHETMARIRQIAEC